MRAPASGDCRNNARGRVDLRLEQAVDRLLAMGELGARALGEVKLGYVARLGSGHTPSRDHPEWWLNCTIPWITTGEVAQMSSDRLEEITETREMISEIGLANSSATVRPKGTVVLCRTAASAGYSAIMGSDMATSQDFATWTCGPRLRPRYLLLCLRAMRSDLLGRLAIGSTHRTIYMPDIESSRSRCHQWRSRTESSSKRGRTSLRSTQPSTRSSVRSSCCRNASRRSSRLPLPASSTPLPRSPRRRRDPVRADRARPEGDTARREAGGVAADRGAVGGAIAEVRPRCSRRRWGGRGTTFTCSTSVGILFGRLDEDADYLIDERVRDVEAPPAAGRSRSCGGTTTSATGGNTTSSSRRSSRRRKASATRCAWMGSGRAHPRTAVGYRATTSCCGCSPTRTTTSTITWCRGHRRGSTQQRSTSWRPTGGCEGDESSLVPIQHPRME